jgi:predicted enzyme related to lactoylglutathione lyase
MRVVETKCIVGVADMQRATRFYVDVFGADVAFESPWWSEIRIAGVNIGLHGGATGERHDSGLGFVVDDLDGACAAVERAGGVIVSPPKERPGEGVMLATITDPEGNEVSLSLSPRAVSEATQ